MPITKIQISKQKNVSAICNWNLEFFCDLGFGICYFKRYALCAMLYANTLKDLSCESC
jgi:hypothetical protein